MPDLNFKYKPGRINEAADALSHAPVSTEEALEGVSEDLRDQVIAESQWVVCWTFLS